jgi:hypothetical protein
VAVVEPMTFAPIEWAHAHAQIVVAGKMPAARLLDTVTLGVDPPPVAPAEPAAAGPWREQGE